MDRIYTKPGHLIRRAQQIALALFFEECGGLDITPVQYACLVAVTCNPGLDATRLSALVAFDRSTIGDVIERVEAKGWLQRSPSPEDKRVKVLALTEAGSRVLDEVEAPIEAAQRRILAPLTPQEQRHFMRLLTRLVDLNNAESRAPLRAPDADAAAD